MNIKKIILILAACASFQANAEGETMAEIKSYCGERWSGDFKMQKYCIDKQIDGFIGFTDKLEEIEEIDPLLDAVVKTCWHWVDKKDYSMADYCTGKQISAYNEIYN